MPSFPRSSTCSLGADGSIFAPGRSRIVSCPSRGATARIARQHRIRITSFRLAYLYRAPARLRGLARFPNLRSNGLCMRAVGVFPDSREVRLVDHPEPSISSPRELKLRMLEVGVCGT